MQMKPFRGSKQTKYFYKISYTLISTSIILIIKLPLILASIIVISFLFLLYPQYNSKFDLFYFENQNNKNRIQKCPSINYGHFYPTFYLGSGFLQAFFGGKSKYCDNKIKFRREELKIEKNGNISLDWAFYENFETHNKKNYIIFIIPGLTATCEEPYIKNICEEALKNGYKVVIYNERHVGPNPSIPENGFIRFEEDLKNTIEVLRKRESDKILAIGHSFGANILLKYLALYNNDSPILGAISVANPFDLWMASKHIKGTIYEKYVTVVRQKNLEQKKHHYIKENKYDLKIKDALSVKTAKEFDEYFSRRLYGYPTVDSYYRKISCATKILEIKIPLLLLQSYDDPIIHQDCIPIDECKKNENAILLITNTGGHVGWFEGNLRPKRWYPKPSIEFLNCIVDEIEKNQNLK